jgi:uncharacterized protein YdeI (BOF family)
MRTSMGILTVAAVMLFAQTATYAAEKTTKEREGAGKISGQETQKQSGQELQKQSGQEMQKPSGQETQRQPGQQMQPQSGESGQTASGNFSEEMQRQNKQIWQAGKQSQSQCQRPGKSQEAASQQPGTQPSQTGQQPPSPQAGQPQGQAGREQTQQVTQDQGKQTQAQSAAGSGSAQTVKGQFIRMEGDFYIIKDESGKETCIPTSYGTFVDQTFSPGNTIVARLGSDGSATVIGRADTQTASAGTEGQGMTGSSDQPPRDKDVAGSQGSQSQGMPGSGDQPPRDKDVAGSQQGSQSPSMGSGSTGQSAKSPKQQTTASVVKGELLKIQGEFYTVKDSSGKEVRLHVNKETKMDSPVNVGDKIEAERTASDHALSIKLAQDAGPGKGEGSRTR